MAHFFITGGTGLFGTNLLPRILKRFSDSTITLLVRGESEEHIRDRVAALCRKIEQENPSSRAGERIEGLKGDVSLEACGLSPEKIEYLANKTTHIVHGAAILRFNLTLEEARKINLRGTERVLAIARRCVDRGNLRRFVYIGTSSVSGKRRDLVLEEELEEGQEFFNSYEQSKFESEKLVRRLMESLPATIFRPSIVIGDSKTGRTSLFNVIYIPLRLLHKGMISMAPASPETLLDLVPIDWAAEAMAAIMQQESSIGRAYHIASGPDRATPLGDVAAHAIRYFDKHSPLQEPRSVEWISREEFRRRIANFHGSQAAVMKQMEHLFAYVTLDRLFDTTNTDRALRESGITFPRYERYADKILEYCLASDWGKKDI